MSARDGMDRNVIALGACAGVFLLFLLVYIFPRSRQLGRTEESIANLSSVRQEVSQILPDVARTAPSKPLPTPDVRSWIAANCLVGIDKNLVANDGYLKGQGAKVRLRRLSPQQAAQFLSQLTRVRLEIERMELQDSDGAGSWDLDIQVRVPQT